MACTDARQGMVFGLSVLNGVSNFMIVSYPKQGLNSVGCSCTIVVVIFG